MEDPPDQLGRKIFLTLELRGMQMYFDDLPLWGFVGKVEKIVKTGVRKYYLFTHFHFEILFKDDKVIEINVSSDPVVSTLQDGGNQPCAVAVHAHMRWPPHVHALC